MTLSNFRFFLILWEYMQHAVVLAKQIPKIITEVKANVYSHFGGVMREQ